MSVCIDICACLRRTGRRVAREQGCARCVSHCTNTMALLSRSHRAHPEVLPVWSEFLSAGKPPWLNIFSCFRLWLRAEETPPFQANQDVPHLWVDFTGSWWAGVLPDVTFCLTKAKWVFTHARASDLGFPGPLGDGSKKPSSFSAAQGRCSCWLMLPHAASQLLPVLWLNSTEHLI